jgi:hypothetical protein
VLTGAKGDRTMYITFVDYGFSCPWYPTFRKALAGLLASLGRGKKPQGISALHQMRGGVGEAAVLIASGRPWSTVRPPSPSGGVQRPLPARRTTSTGHGAWWTQ